MDITVIFLILVCYVKDSELMEKTFYDQWSPLVDTFDEIVKRVKVNGGKTLDDILFIESIQSNLLKGCEDNKIKDIDGPRTMSFVAGTDTKIYMLAHPRDQIEEQYFWILPAVDCSPRVYEPDSEESEELRFNKKFSNNPWANLLSRFNEITKRAYESGGKVIREDITTLNDLKIEISRSCSEGKMRQLNVKAVSSVANVETRTYVLTDEKYSAENLFWVLPDAECTYERQKLHNDPNSKGFWDQPVKPRHLENNKEFQNFRNTETSNSAFDGQNSEVRENSFQDQWSPLVGTFNEIVTRVKANKGKSLDDIIFIESIQSNVLKDCESGTLQDIDGPHTTNLVAGTNTKIYVLAHPRDQTEEQFFWTLPAVDCSPRVFEPDSEESEEEHINKMFSSKPITTLMSRFHEIIQRAAQNGNRVRPEDIRMIYDLRADIYVACAEGKMKQRNLNAVPSVANVITRTYELTDQQNPTESFLWVLPDANCPYESQQKTQDSHAKGSWDQPGKPRPVTPSQPLSNNNDPSHIKKPHNEQFAYHNDQPKPGDLIDRKPAKNDPNIDFDFGITRTPPSRPKKPPRYVIIENPLPGDLGIGVTTPNMPTKIPEYGTHSKSGSSPFSPDSPKQWNQADINRKGDEGNGQNAYFQRPPFRQGVPSDDINKPKPKRFPQFSDNQYTFAQHPESISDAESSVDSLKKVAPKPHSTYNDDRASSMDSDIYKDSPNKLKPKIFLSNINEPNDKSLNPTLKPDQVLDANSGKDYTPYYSENEHINPHISDRKMSGLGDYVGIPHREPQNPLHPLNADLLPDYMSKATPKPYFSEPTASKPPYTNGKIDGLGYPVDDLEKQGKHSPYKPVKTPPAVSHYVPGYPEKTGSSPEISHDIIDINGYNDQSTRPQHFTPFNGGDNNNNNWLEKAYPKPEVQLPTKSPPQHLFNNPETFLSKPKEGKASGPDGSTYMYGETSRNPGQDFTPYYPENEHIKPHITDRKIPYLGDYAAIPHTEPQNPLRPLNADLLPDYLSKATPKPDFTKPTASKPQYTSGKIGELDFPVNVLVKQDEKSPYNPVEPPPAISYNVPGYPEKTGSNHEASHDIIDNTGNNDQDRRPKHYTSFNYEDSNNKDFLEKAYPKPEAQLPTKSPPQYLFNKPETFLSNPKEGKASGPDGSTYMYGETRQNPNLPTDEQVKLPHTPGNFKSPLQESEQYKPFDPLKIPQTSLSNPHLASDGYSGIDHTGNIYIKPNSKQNIIFDVDVQVSHTSEHRPKPDKDSSSKHEKPRLKPDRRSRKQSEKGRNESHLQSTEENVQQKKIKKPQLATDTEINSYIERTRRRFKEQS